MSINSNQIFI